MAERIRAASSPLVLAIEQGTPEDVFPAQLQQFLVEVAVLRSNCAKSAQVSLLLVGLGVHPTS